MKKTLPILFLTVLAAAAAIYFLNARNRGNRSGPDIHTGTVEATEVTVSFRLPGHVTSVMFEEGQYVNEGQILAVLDTVSLSQEVTRTRAALETARSRLSTAGAGAAYLQKAVQAQIEGAQANLQKLETGLRPQEIEAARQAVESARAEAERARTEAERARRLYAGEVIPLAKLQNAEASERVSRARLISAEENLAVAEMGTRTEDIRTAGAALSSAKARLDEVRGAFFQVQALENEIKVREAELALALTRLDHATLKAPLSGIALTKSLEPGENVQASRPVTTIADLSEVKVRFYVPANGLGTLNLGETITVESDASPGQRFEGHVSYISEQAEFTPKSIQTREERTKLVYMLRAIIPNPGRKLKPGMPVDILTEH